MLTSSSALGMSPSDQDAGDTSGEDAFSQGETAEEESLEELLSGPKDSFMKFGSQFPSRYRRSGFDLDISTGGDPLDLLVQAVQARDDPGVSGSSSSPCRTESLASASTSASPVSNATVTIESEVEETGCHAGLTHQQELALRCKADLNRALDIFHCEPSAAQQDLNRSREEIDKQNQQIQALRKRITELVKSKQDAESAKAESDRSKAISDDNLWRLADQVDILKAQARKDAKDESVVELARLAESVDLLTAEARQATSQLSHLRGDRETLRALSPAELSALAETLSDSLRRVQHEHQRKLEQKIDEQLCVACLSERKNVVLQPCNHLTMCKSCFDQCSSTCPQCRAEVRGHLVIFL